MSTANENLSLNVRGRTGLGKNAAFKSREAKLIPGIVYGPKVKTPFTIAVIPNEIKDLYKKAGRTGLITLTAVEGASGELSGQKVLIKEIQTHPYKNYITHVDLHQIDLSKKLRVTVPLQFTGKAKGLAEGGILSIIARSVEIKCLPQDIPNHIDADVSELGIMDSLHIEELAKKYEASGKLEFIYEANLVLAAVVPPEAEEVAAPVVAAADAAAAPGAAGAAAAPGAAGAAPAAGAKPAPGAAPAAAAKAPAKK